jgi:hypothetical protein
MRCSGLRKFFATPGAVLEQVCDPKLGRDIDTLGHLETPDELLQNELRRNIIRGHGCSPLVSTTWTVKY